MSESVQVLSRGGMCANPFGGEDRIDRINLLEFLEPNASPDKVLYLRIIQDAVSNYLYAFLGKNGTSAKEFFSAWQYFFKVVSTNKASWDHHRTIKHSYLQDGKKVAENHYLTDSELQMMCFDKHYEMSGLSNHVDIEKFRSGLKAKRKKILDNNWDQVVNYVNALYQRELSQVVDGHQVPFQVWNEDLKIILTDPPTPQHLASVIYVPSKLKRPLRARAKKSSKQMGMYSKLVENLQSNHIATLSGNWGPIASFLEGEGNVQITNNDSNNSVLCDPDRCSTTS